MKPPEENSTNNRWDSEGNYHDDDVRLEAYAEVETEFQIADIKPDLINKVVQSIQMEIGEDILKYPSMTVQQIKLAAMHRFIDLIDKGLLSYKEAEKCYQRFANQVDWYYGS